MSDKKPSSKELRTVNPDDYYNYEQQFFVSKSGGSGAKTAKQKGDKTLRDIKKQQWKGSQESRQAELENVIRRVLDGFPDFKTDLERDQFLEKYVNWVAKNLTSLNPLDLAQIEIKFSKSGGPGGQNVNKRETKVSLIHQPTNIRAESDQTRSQLKNKTLAFELLQESLQNHINDWKQYLDPGQILDLELIQNLLHRLSG
ncbi:MAG: hypothetical protein DRJ13_13690 [Bacteroidetes bacterium]|nr:MAG: hypothetical protein DRJ13_13690 [Bacteroidota bacterium]